MAKLTASESKRLYDFASQFGNVKNNFDQIFGTLVTNPTAILTRIEQNGYSTITYRDIDGEPCSIDDKNLNYKIVGTGIKDKGEEILLSYHRNGSLAPAYSEDAWNGCFVGTLTTLSKQFLKFAQGNTSHYNVSSPNITVGDKPISYLERNAVKKAETVAIKNAEKSKTDVTARVNCDNPNIEYVDTDYSPLVTPKRWAELVGYIENRSSDEFGGFDNLSQLINYLTIIEIRTLLVKSRNDNSLVMSKDGKYVICNSGTKTKLFNKPIFFVAETSEKSERFISVTPLSDRRVLAELGFEEKDFNATPNRISFFDMTESVIYRYGKADVDLENEHSVLHCLKDRVERLPERFRVALLEKRLTYYMNDMDKAFDRQQIDPFYFKPFFDKDRKKIQFIIPVYKNDNPKEEIEYGYVLADVDGYWRVYTVLTADMVRNTIKPLSPYIHY